MAFSVATPSGQASVLAEAFGSKRNAGASRAFRGLASRYEAVTGESLKLCLVCRQGNMVMADILLPTHHWERCAAVGITSS
jgi:hypothetical protein